MDAELTKSFAFSASYSRAARSIGVNYTFSVSVPAVDEEAEKELESVVRRELISKLHTRDLSEHVDFLKGVEISDEALLRVFWALLAKPLERYGIRSLSLRRDGRTVTTLHP